MSLPIALKEAERHMRKKLDTSEIVHIAACVGVDAFGVAAQEAWDMKTKYYYEIDPEAIDVMKLQVPLAVNFGDVVVSSSEANKELLAEERKRNPVILMTAGVPCQSFSTAGKRGFDGSILSAVIQRAGELSVDALIVECVPDLVNADINYDGENWIQGSKVRSKSNHDCCSTAIHLAKRLGLTLLSTDLFTDSATGGSTTRTRVFLFFVKTETAETKKGTFRILNEKKIKESVPLCTALDFEKNADERLFVKGVFLPSRKPDIQKHQVSHAGVLLYGLPLEVGTLVAVVPWMGSAIGVKTLRISQIPSQSEPYLFKSGKVSVVAEDLRWIPCSKEGSKLLKLGFLVAIEGEKRWFKIMSFLENDLLRTSVKSGKSGKLVYDTMHRDLIVAVKVERIAVLDTRGLGFCIRRYGDDPQGATFLIKTSTKGIRRLSGREAWQLQGLSLQVANKLLANGLGDDVLGRLAGNAIPYGMAKLAVNSLLVWLCHGAQEVLSRSQEPYDSLIVMNPGNAVDETVFKQISVLVIKISERPQLLVVKTAPSILTLGYLVGDRSLLGDALKKIWLRVQYLVGEVAEPFQYSQVADLKRIDVVCFVPDKGEQLKEVNSELWEWTELESLPYGLVLCLGLKALQLAYSFKNYVSCLANEQDIAWHDAQKAVLFNAEVSGVVKADLVAPKMIATNVDLEGVEITWASILQDDVAALKVLGQAIDGRIADSTDSEEKVIWAEWKLLLIPLPSVELPEKLVEEAHHYMDAHLATLPMVDRCPIDVTEWRELPPAQLAPLSFKPQCTADLLNPKAWKILEEWLARQTKEILSVDA